MFAGILVGGLGGVLRGDWLGQRAANVVKENLEMQLRFVREQHAKVEAEIKEELRKLGTKIDRLLERGEIP